MFRGYSFRRGPGTSGWRSIPGYALLVEDDIAQGRLVPVLEDYAGCIRSVSLLYPHRRYTPLRVRAFVEFLLDALRPTNGLAAG